MEGINNSVAKEKNKIRIGGAGPEDNNEKEPQGYILGVRWNTMYIDCTRQVRDMRELTRGNKILSCQKCFIQVSLATEAPCTYYDMSGISCRCQASSSQRASIVKKENAKVQSCQG